jgi:glycosyltransferase involved in cell wall biosynthesis
MHKRCTVLHNGIAIPHAARHPRATAPLRMVYLGRVVPWKGCEMLIRMVDTARRSMHADVELDIVGGTLYWSQEYRRELRDMIDRLELSGCCKLSEHTEQIGEVFSSHHLFCNASLQEPFGRSVAEAQAWGLPVVAFRSGGTEEIVVDGKSGYLVEPGDVGALAEAVMRFVRDPALIEIMGEFARKRAMEKFNREKQLGTCMELLRGMIIASD